MPNLLLPTSDVQGLAGLQQRDITCRELQLRAASIDEQARSFEATVATETPAFVFDWRNYEVIEEVLRAEGGRFPEWMPLLNDHRRYGADSVIGSAIDFRRTGDRWGGRGVVAEPGDAEDPVNRIWSRLKGRHIRAVSIGYVVRNYVDIPAGQKQRVAGKLYEANETRLRISTEWEVHELSLTPIGADSEALIRSARHLLTLDDRRPQSRSYFAS